MTAYLNPRLIAIQGFELTPIAMAVQGLLAILAEEQKNQVYGSGRRLGVPADWNTKAFDKPLAKPSSELSEDALVDKVLEKWAAIEEAQAARAEPAPDIGIPITEPEKSVITPDVKTQSFQMSDLAPKPIPVIPAITGALDPFEEQQRRNAEKVALILALASAL